MSHRGDAGQRDTSVQSLIASHSKQNSRVPVCTVAIPLSLILFTGCAYRAAVHTKDISSYRGDGVASKIHSLVDPGILIEFNKFSLSEPYHAVYQLKALPLRPTPYHVALVVDSPGRALDPHRPRGDQYGLPGKLRLHLIDRWEFASREGSFFDYTWSPEEDGWASEAGEDHEGRVSVYAVAERLGTMIEPAAMMHASEGHLVLEVSWNPGNGVPPKTAWIRMESGGNW